MNRYSLLNLVLTLALTAIIALHITNVYAATEKIGDLNKDIPLVSLKGGCFKMGSVEDKNVHEVCVSDFAIGKFEITQGQWQDVMGVNPSRFSSCGSDCPVDQVGWNDIQLFIKKLNEKTGKRYRLPTEAEWEYAARSGGKSEKYSGGDNIDAVAWYDNNAEQKPHQVGTKQANSFGIYDMSGNVWEWVNDCYRENYYKTSPKNDPQGPSCSDKYVLRGGSWFNTAKNSNVAFRLRDNPGFSYHFTFGFRLAVSSKE